MRPRLICLGNVFNVQIHESQSRLIDCLQEIIEEDLASEKLA
jgi:hypothetical protein